MYRNVEKLCELLMILLCLRSDISESQCCDSEQHPALVQNVNSELENLSIERNRRT